MNRMAFALTAAAIVIVYRYNRPIPTLTDQRFAKALSHFRRMCKVIELMHLAGNKPTIRV